MAPPRHPLRDWILGMYRSGVLVSPADGATIASVPRQTVSRWLREAKINVDLAHEAFIGRQYTRAQRYLEGKPQARKLTKKQMRDATEKAVESFNEANVKIIPIGRRAMS